MRYGFSVYQTNVDDHVFWIAESNDLKGCVGQGDTVDAAITTLEENENEWLDAAEKYGIEIPTAQIEKISAYSGKFMVRVSPLVHEETVRQAKNQGISLNQYVNDAIVSRNSAHTTANMIKDIVRDFKTIVFDSSERVTTKGNVIPYTFNIESSFERTSDGVLYKVR